MVNAIRKQVVSNPDNWLHNEPMDYTRTFAKFIYLGVDSPEWAECTNEEKEQWEREHPTPEPEQQ